jgi:hypothetical protein
VNDINFMEMQMKTIAKIICCGVALVWMCSATAREEAADATSEAEGEVTETTSAAGGGASLPTAGSSIVLSPIAGTGMAIASAGGDTAAMQAAAADVAGSTSAAVEDVTVPTPPATRVVVKPYHDKVDRAKVEKRIEDNAVRTRKRSADAEKDVAERAAKKQQGQ